MPPATEDRTAKKLREQSEEILALRREIATFRQDMDMLRSGRLGTLGFKTSALVGDNALNTAKYKDASVTSAKIASMGADKLTEGDVAGNIGIPTAYRVRWADFVQVDADGIKVKAAVEDPNNGASETFFYILPEFFAPGNDPPAAYIWHEALYVGSQPEISYTINAGKATGGARASFELYTDAGQAIATLATRDTSGVLHSLSLSPGSGSSKFGMGTTVRFALAQVTADFATVFDSEMWYRTDTDKFRVRANGVTENLATETYAGAGVTTHEAASDPHTGYVREADANWVDLTDLGATTLHSHAAAGGSMKTSGGGYYLLPAGPAIGSAVADSATDDTYGAWVEMRAAAGNALFIVGVTIRANTAPGTTGDYAQLDIGTGAAASEVSIGEWYFPDIAIDSRNITLPFPIPVAATTRIAVRVADSETIINTYQVTLHVIDQADLVAI